MTSIVYMPEGHDLESYLCSQEWAAEFSLQGSSDSEQLDTSSGTPIASKLSRPELETESSTMHRSSETSELLSKTDTPKPTQEESMSSAGDFHALRFQSPESKREKTTNEICGQQLLNAYGKLDQDTASLRTFQLSLLPDILEPSSLTWPRAGILCDGVVYRQPKWERRIAGIASGLLPTPTVGMVTGGQNPETGGQAGLGYMARSGLWPTPRAGKTTDEDEDTWMARHDAGKVSTPPLTLAVKMWPTPSAQEPGWVVGGQVEIVDKDGNPPTHHNQRFYDKNTGRIVQKGLTQVTQMWPTPTSTDDSHRESTTGQPKLSQVNRWPTPTVDDANNSTRASGDFQSLTRNVHESSGGKLNADWVEILMGWPKGWSSLDPLDIEEFNNWFAGFSGEESTYGIAAWQDGSWENETPRVSVEDDKNRTNRLKAIGNGQVSIVAATAWILLTES